MREMRVNKFIVDCEKQNVAKPVKIQSEVKKKPASINL